MRAISSAGPFFAKCCFPNAMVRELHLALVVIVA